MNRASPYGCTTAMLEVARERGVEDQRVFKVILGVRKLIKTFSRQFILMMHGQLVQVLTSLISFTQEKVLMLFQ